MKIGEIINFLETIAPASLQESYDNTGLIMGDRNKECSGVLCALDSTEEVIEEAIRKQCNLVIAHHPIIFKGLKRINGNNYVERVIISAIRNDIGIYAIHTNLDNIQKGVNGKIAEKLGLVETAILDPRPGMLKKLFCFVPVDHAEKVRAAIFEAGAGHIGKYDQCSFNSEGTGTYRAGEGAKPFMGAMGEIHHEKETRMEMVFPYWQESKIVKALLSSHPYEEVAYDIISLSNEMSGTGSGIIGKLAEPVEQREFLDRVKLTFGLPMIRHTAGSGKKISRVAVCGGAGSFLISKALRTGADAFLTSDLKYHEFFDAENRMLLADLGHYESEQFTTDLIAEELLQKFPTFAVLKTSVITNPVHYY